jgi:hypothetical protein
MEEEKPSYARGKNPNSAHGKSTGRPLEHGERKVRLNVTVTPSAKIGLQALADKHQCSISELIEKIGQGMVDISI